MIKDNVRDYATEAFRKYALLGKLSGDELKAKIMRGTSDEDKALCSVNRCIPLIMDIEAVHRTMAQLESDNKVSVIKAVEAVYFAYPKKPLKKNDVTLRVTAFGCSYGASERTVFYWLKEARDIFADFRGLDTDKKILETLQ